MKLVVVDVGNTSTAVGKWSGGRVTCVAHCDDGFAGASAKVRALASAGACAMAYLSVVPKADAAWRRHTPASDPNAVSGTAKTVNWSQQFV